MDTTIIFMNTKYYKCLGSDLRIVADIRMVSHYSSYEQKNVIKKLAPSNIRNLLQLILYYDFLVSVPDSYCHSESNASLVTLGLCNKEILRHNSNS